MHDVLVAGGGPAGLAVALGAARAGLSVVVCERRAGTLDKACGEGVMPGALRALQELGVDPPGADIRGIGYRQGTTAVDADFPDGPGRGVRRLDLHAALRRATTERGVEIIEGDAVTDVHQHPDHVEAGGLRARYLVAADGLHSPLRRAVGLEAPARGVRRWGQRRHYAVAPGTDLVEVHWGARSEAYLTPVGPELLGVAVLSATRADLDTQLRAFPAVAAKLAAAAPASDVRGAGPLRRRVTGRTAGRVALVGDAAGYVDALTGEGLAVSLAGARVLVRALAADDLSGYDAAWQRVTRRSRWLTETILWARQRPALAPRIVPAARRCPALFSAAVAQLAG